MLSKFFKKGLPFVLLAIWLQGCSQMTLSATGHHAGREVGSSYRAAAPPVSPELNDFFENAAPDTVIRAASSPWGEEVEIAVASFYDAASGRHCRGLSISHPVVGSKPGLVCRTRPGQWEPVRPIARQ
jgi:hypothetical protein